MEAEEYCPLCGKISTDFDEHKLSDTHKFNFKLCEWQKYKLALVKDRHGIEIKVNVYDYKKKLITSEYNTKKGRYTCQIKDTEENLLNNGITYVFTICNTRKNDHMLLLNFDTLHPVNYWTKHDVGGLLTQGKFAELEDGAEYHVNVQFKGSSVSDYRMPVAFTFQDKKCKRQFTLARELVVCIVNKFSKLTDELGAKGKSPFTNKQWSNITYINALNYRPRSVYFIPKEIRNVLFYGLKVNRHFNGQDYIHCERIKTSFNIGCTAGNYGQYFHYLLWLDEMGAEVKIQRYNMENVEVRLVNGNFLELNVPGLAEKRPSLIVGDEIKIKEYNQNVAYGGIIIKVMNEEIRIGQVREDFIKHIKSSDGEKLQVDVKFSIGRLQYERMHQAVDLCSRIERMPLLIPTGRNDSNVTTNKKITNFYNHHIIANLEQKKAVENIVNRSSGHEPFIVFGPPGTGKTVTIVEAIIQIAKSDKSAKILVCAPSNAACDMLVLKLSDHFNKDTLIRIHSDVCDWKVVPEKVTKYSNRNGNDTKKLTGEELSKYQIVITTLILIGRYVNHFERTHVFIDEAAQAKEPEALIGVAGILKPYGQLVLSGDPKQLGPSLNSDVAKQYGLDVSLLARLMDNFPQYQPVDANSKYIIKLKNNYRSHPQIIHIPNEMYYNGELKAISMAPINDVINKVVLPVNKSKAVKPQAIEFYGVNGQEQREGFSPSFFNWNEISVVMRYVEALTNTSERYHVQPEEIGIIAPYIRQVMRIRNNLEKLKLNAVEVGTTESFQGREKRVMIISTVRAKADLLLYDEKYNLGFVRNDQRFNVAITRAISKLIIVGNPHVLCYSPAWAKLIKHCQDLKSYRGVMYSERNKATKQIIITKMSNMKLKDDQYNHEP